MAFVDQLKTFTNRGPYEQGEEFITHKGITTNTVINSKEYEEYLETLMETPSTIWTIPPGYEHRPDSISYKFYGAPELFWIILRYNNITDPFESLGVGTKIRIPQI